MKKRYGQEYRQYMMFRNHQKLVIECWQWLHGCSPLSIVEIGQ
jgi:sarcosine oxidase delta subunit